MLSLRLFLEVEHDSESAHVIWKIDWNLYAGPVSDFLFGSICSVQFDLASVKNRLGRITGIGYNSRDQPLHPNHSWNAVQTCLVESGGKAVPGTLW